MSFLVDMETLRAVIRADKAGQIELEEIRGKSRSSSSSISALARFLGEGWLEPTGKTNIHSRAAFTAIQMIDQGMLDPDLFLHLGRKLAEQVVEQARKTQREIRAARKRDEKLKRPSRSTTTGQAHPALRKPALQRPRTPDLLSPTLGQAEGDRAYQLSRTPFLGTLWDLRG